MKTLIKPNALKKGDLVATVSLSWGGAGIFRERYEQGKKQFENSFGVKIVEMKNSLCSPQELYNAPQLRLDDLIEAFLNPEIKAILCNIGGSDTIRLLRYMNEKHFKIIKNNPKIFLGMSDTTTNHFMCFKAGLSSFYSPSTMFGYAENGGIPNVIVESTRKTLFATDKIGILNESKEFVVEKVEWDDKNSVERQRIASSPWRYIQGNKIAKGKLLGGCMEVLNMINGTSLWPNIEEWNDTILFIETSEEMPNSDQLLYFLRNMGAQGILNRIKGILFARPGGEFKLDEETQKKKWLDGYLAFDEVILKACKEYDCSDICVVTNMDFGHTVPQLILPIGAMTEIDPKNKRVSIVENAVV